MQKINLSAMMPLRRGAWMACLGILLILLGGCKKGNSTSALTALVGTWEIRSAQNSIIPTIYYPPGNDSLLKFTFTNYTLYSKGQIVRTGTYKIVDDSSYSALNLPAGQFAQAIIFEGSTNPNKVLFQITGDRLRFISGNFQVDGGSDTVYERL